MLGLEGSESEADDRFSSPCCSLHRSSTFTREDSDPTTPARELQCTLGIEAHRILGKEVKEEQNRLTGSVVRVLVFSLTRLTTAFFRENQPPSRGISGQLVSLQPSPYRR